MKSILKKVAGVALIAVLALGMFGCSSGSSDDPVKPPVISTENIPVGFVKVKGGNGRWKAKHRKLRRCVYRRTHCDLKRLLYVKV